MDCILRSAGIQRANHCRNLGKIHRACIYFYVRGDILFCSVGVKLRFFVVYEGTDRDKLVRSCRRECVKACLTFVRIVCRKDRAVPNCLRILVEIFCVISALLFYVVGNGSDNAVTYGNRFFNNGDNELIVICSLFS